MKPVSVYYSKSHMKFVYILNVFLFVLISFITYGVISSGLISGDELSNIKSRSYFYIVFIVFFISFEIFFLITTIRWKKYRIIAEENRITVKKLFSETEYDFKDILFADKNTMKSRYNINNKLEFNITFENDSGTKRVYFNENMQNWEMLAERLLKLGYLKD